MVIKHFRMAKTDAERARAYRQRKKESLGSSWLKKENERVKKYYIKSSELSKKKLNARRSKIRQYVHKYRLRQKTEARDLRNENLPGSSSADTNTDVMDSQVSSTSTAQEDPLPTCSKAPVADPTPTSSATRKRTSRAVARGYRKIKKLEEQNHKLQKKVDSLRKKFNRIKEKVFTKSPRGQTDKEMRSNGVSPTKHPTIRRKILLANCMAEEIQFAVKKNPAKKSIIAGITAGKIIKKYRLTNELSNMTKMSKETLLRSKKTLFEKSRKVKQIYKTLKTTVQTFLEREDNSRQLPGKQDAVKVAGEKEKAQKFVLNDYMYNLFLKFKAENPTMKISLSTFCRLRPKQISLVNFAARVTCLCTKHQNFALKLKCLKLLGVNSETSPDKFAEKFGEKDVTAILAKIKQQDITYQEWKRMKCDDGKQRMKLKSTDRGKKDFCSLFQQDFKLFCEHESRVKTQYKAFKDMKDKLMTNPNHILVHMDFAENYSCQTMEEIQSAYWNAEMVTLHPAVIYYCNNQNEICHKSIVFVSNVLHHNSSFVSIVIENVIIAAKQMCPGMTHIHYWTDSPTSQYRNKVIFDLVARHPQLYDLTQASWHYFESGHGKGACDGIGGTTKRNADNAVKRGLATIQSAADFYQWAATSQSKIEYSFISQDEYNTAFSKLTTRQNMLKAIRGTLKLHAAVGLKNGVIMTRETTCTCQTCFKPGEGFSFTENSSCSWEIHSVLEEQVEYVAFLENLGKHVTEEDPTGSENEVDRHMQAGHEKETLDLLKNINIDVGDYVAAIYDSEWFIGMVTGTDLPEDEYKISFYEKTGKTSNCLKWPKVKDEIWLPKQNILCKVEEPEPTGKSKRLFKLLPAELELIQDMHKDWKKIV